MRTRAALALVFVAASAPLAQQPRDNPRRTDGGTATLAGRVVTGDAESRPLRKAIVMLRSDDGRVQRSAIADDGGAFSFAALPPGRYALDASRRGWPTITYGATRPHQRGTRIDLADGQRLDDIVIRMPRGAVLTGSIVDQAGMPLAHTPVVALRFSFVNGERRLTRYREDDTDDRGVYRLYGLPAGEYLVATAGAPAVFEDLGTIQASRDVDVRQIPDAAIRQGFRRSAGAGGAPTTTVGFAPVYYPGTPMRADAMHLTVAAGEERSALDFEAAAVRAVAVEGMVDAPGGLPSAAPVRVTLRATGGDADVVVGDDRQTVAGSDGAFTFGGVPPGRYELSARLVQAGTAVLWASSRVVVAGDHAPGVLLVLRPAWTFTGRAVFEGQAAGASAIRIALQSVPAGDTLVAEVDEAGNFAVNGLVPGRYRVEAAIDGRRLTGAWSLKSFVVNGAEMLEAVITVGSSLSGAVATFTDRYGAVSGTVQDTAGRAARERFVVVFPTDPERWRPLSWSVHAVRPAFDGRYLIEHLAPGEYFLATAVDIEEGEWLDPTVLQRLSGAALRFKVGEGQRHTVDLKVE